VQVLVRDNNVDQALKVLKKKMQREGVFREMKLRAHYEKPSEKKARERAEAIRRAQARPQETAARRAAADEAEAGVWRRSWRAARWCWRAWRSRRGSALNKTFADLNRITGAMVPASFF